MEKTKLSRMRTQLTDVGFYETINETFKSKQNPGSIVSKNETICHLHNIYDLSFHILKCQTEYVSRVMSNLNPFLIVIRTWFISAVIYAGSIALCIERTLATEQLAKQCPNILRLSIIMLQDLHIEDCINYKGPGVNSPWKLVTTRRTTWDVENCV